MTKETFTFQAEVSKLLDIVVHSLYSNKQIFLRELISNASDACDRLRYTALTYPELLKDGQNLQIILIPDSSTKTLTIVDNGIGMSREELIEHLGTIAQSGTSAFIQQLADNKQTSPELIGQFGVGFYSAFMVSDTIEVISCKAGTEQGWHWSSDGRGTFTIEQSDSVQRGTRVTLHLKADEQEYLEASRLRHLVKTYSDHIAFPVLLKENIREELINEASALWTRPRSDISETQYKEFYRHVSHALDEPWLTIHYRAEGTIEYTALLFIPTVKPFDLFHQDRKHHVKLYVRRVFITDDCSDLLPAWLRFLKGIVDSQDLPLNVSREMLQHNSLLAKIRNGLIRHVLTDLQAKTSDAESYALFWNTFGIVLKEGLYEDFERKNDIIPLCRFQTTKAKLVSLEDYVKRMREGQDAIYYITGDDPEVLATSPHLEGFLNKGVEVLLLTDPIDEFWPTALDNYQGQKLVSVAHVGAELGKIKDTTAENIHSIDEIPDLNNLLSTLKKFLGEAVKDVRISERLTTSLACLVADQNDMSSHLEKLLRQHHQIKHQAILRVLEINPHHRLIKRLADMTQIPEKEEVLKEAAMLLLDQARIISHEPLPDPIAFANRVAIIMERSFSV